MKQLNESDLFDINDVVDLTVESQRFDQDNKAIRILDYNVTDLRKKLNKLRYETKVWHCLI